MKNTEEKKTYLKKLLKIKGFEQSDIEADFTNEFIHKDEFTDKFNVINQTQDEMVLLWKKRKLIKEVLDLQIRLPNATVGKSYSSILPIKSSFGDRVDVVEVIIQGCDIKYDKDSNTISAYFKDPGVFIVEIKFKTNEFSSNEIDGIISSEILVNPDPKTLWKNLESNREDSYWKEDDDSASGIFGSKKLIIGSKRGRSHAHEGLFRDDDFSHFYSEENKWGIIAVADGAGSAKYSRKGSKIACEAVKQYFMNLPNDEILNLKANIEKEIMAPNKLTQMSISSFCIAHNGKAAYSALQSISEEAKNNEANIKDYSTTLLFSFIKEVNDKLFISSFWVGDGGIGVYRSVPNDITILGEPDSGEYSGQTRFLTMKQIFEDNAHISRIKYMITDLSSKVVLMTDGISDAKFETDAALNSIESWNSFFKDLNGHNDECEKVDFDGDLENAESKLMNWLDFWSPGNHDDRTLAILY